MTQTCPDDHFEEVFRLASRRTERRTSVRKRSAFDAAATSLHSQTKGPMRTLTPGRSPFLDGDRTTFLQPMEKHSRGQVHAGSNKERLKRSLSSA
jgi:hypothetical protein